MRGQEERISRESSDTKRQDRLMIIAHTHRHRQTDRHEELTHRADEIARERRRAGNRDKVRWRWRW